MNRRNFLAATTAGVGGITIGSPSFANVSGEHNIYECIADLVAASLASGSYVKTLGYYEKGDGGGADYLIKTVPESVEDGDHIDDSGNHMLTNGCAAILTSNSGIVNAAQFGCDLTGATNSTECFLDFVKYLSISGKYSIGYIGGVGDIILVDSLNITPAKKFKMFGGGGILKRSDSPSANILEFRNSTFGVELSGLVVEGDFTRTGKGGHGIVGVNVSNFRCEDTIVSDVKSTGIIIYASSGVCENNFLINCVINGVGVVRNGLLLADCAYSGIENGRVFNVTEFALELKNSCVHSWIRGGLVDGCNLYGIAFGQTTGSGPKFCAVSDIVLRRVDGGIEMAYGSYNQFSNIHMDFDENPGTVNGVVNCSTESSNNSFSGLIAVNVPANMYAIRHRARNENNICHFSIIDQTNEKNSVRFDSTASNNTVVIDRLSVLGELKDELDSFVSNANASGTNKVLYSRQV